jgi:general stress protein 26
MEPIASRLELPSDYGEPSKEKPLLPWSYVTDRMSRAMHYWLSTVGPDGAPHTRPIAGLWLDEALYFGGSPRSRWNRNLRTEPRAEIHLSEEGDQAVILHGRVEVVRPDRDLAVRLTEASNAKYRFGQKPEDYERIDVFAFRPAVAYAWKALDSDRTRWRFP